MSLGLSCGFHFYRIYLIHPIIIISITYYQIEHSKFLFRLCIAVINIVSGDFNDESIFILFFLDLNFPAIMLSSITEERSEMLDKSYKKKRKIRVKYVLTN